MGKSFWDEAGRANAFKASPWQVFVVGLDVCKRLGRPHKEGEHPLWQGRALEAPDERLVRSILAKGVIKPVLFDKDEEDRAVVVDGRRRIVAAREACKRLEAQGEEPFEVLFVPSRTGRVFDAQNAVAVMAGANELAVEVGPMEKARLAYDMIQRRTEPKIVAAVFGITPEHLQGVWLPLVSATDEVKALVNSRVVTLAEGAKLMKMKASEREEAIAKIQAGPPLGETAPSASWAEPEKPESEEKKQRKAVKKALGQSVAPGKRQLKKAFASLVELRDNEKGVKLRSQYQAACDVLAWVLGEGEMPAWAEGEES